MRAVSARARGGGRACVVHAQDLVCEVKGAVAAAPQSPERARAMKLDPIKPVPYGRYRAELSAPLGRCRLSPLLRRAAFVPRAASGVGVDRSCL